MVRREGNKARYEEESSRRMKRDEWRWKIFQLDVCPRSWELGIGMLWLRDEKLFNISFGPFHLTMIFDKKKQELLHKLGYK